MGNQDKSGQRGKQEEREKKQTPEKVKKAEPEFTSNKNHSPSGVCEEFNGDLLHNSKTWTLVNC